MDEIDPVNQDREDILLTHTAKNILFFPEDDIYGWVHNIEKIQNIDAENDPQHHNNMEKKYTNRESCCKMIDIGKLL